MRANTLRDLSNWWKKRSPISAAKAKNRVEEYLHNSIRCLYRPSNQYRWRKHSSNRANIGSSPSSKTKSKSRRCPWLNTPQNTPILHPKIQLSHLQLKTILPIKIVSIRNLISTINSNNNLEIGSPPKLQSLTPELKNSIKAKEIQNKCSKNGVARAVPITKSEKTCSW